MEARIGHSHQRLESFARWRYPTSEYVWIGGEYVLATLDVDVVEVKND